MEHEVCPKFDQATKMLGKPWVGLIVNQLLLKTKRFSQLESEIHISGRVLSVRLKELEKMGIVERHVIPDVPVKVEYSLTAMGKSLAPVMQSIADWAQDWIR
ncbi:MAG: helix-turn-helix transcriptional regulator [Bacillus subtilis]|nr:helix-turn-helix transcriptional regulator [Bacillus subtilis]